MMQAWTLKETNTAKLRTDSDLGVKLIISRVQGAVHPSGATTSRYAPAQGQAGPGSPLEAEKFALALSRSPSSNRCAKSPHLGRCVGERVDVVCLGPGNALGESLKSSQQANRKLRSDTRQV